MEARVMVKGDPDSLLDNTFASPIA